MKRILLCLVFAGVITSCNDDKTKRLEKLEKQVNDLQLAHDLKFKVGDGVAFNACGDFDYCPDTGVVIYVPDTASITHPFGLSRGHRDYIYTVFSTKYEKVREVNQRALRNIKKQ